MSIIHNKSSFKVFLYLCYTIRKIELWTSIVEQTRRAAEVLDHHAFESTIFVIFLQIFKNFKIKNKLKCNK